MLHRKLILTLGSFIVMMLGTSIWAIVLFAMAVGELSGMGESLLHRTEAITRIERNLDRVEAHLMAMEGSPGSRPETLETDLGVLQASIADLISELEEHATESTELESSATNLVEGVQVAAAATTPEDALESVTAAQLHARPFRQAMTEAGRNAQAEFDRRHMSLTSRLRWWAFGLGLAFLVVINLSVLVIIRATAMVLKPMGELLEASRHFAVENFGYRVPIHRKDEFGTLALATNQMAEALEQNEQRRIEALQHLGRTLNHELNNAMAVIDLQLRVIENAQSEGERAKNQERLKQIHETLQNMSRTVISLGRIRRIVLTDYVGKVKMIDLEQSLLEDDGKVETDNIPAGIEARVAT